PCHCRIKGNDIKQYHDNYEAEYLFFHPEYLFIIYWLGIQSLHIISKHHSETAQPHNKSHTTHSKSRNSSPYARNITLKSRIALQSCTQPHGVAQNRKRAFTSLIRFFGIKDID